MKVLDGGKRSVARWDHLGEVAGALEDEAVTVPGRKLQEDASGVSGAFGDLAVVDETVSPVEAPHRAPRLGQDWDTTAFSTSPTVGSLLRSGSRPASVSGGHVIEGEMMENAGELLWQFLVGRSITEAVHPETAAKTLAALTHRRSGKELDESNGV